MSRAGYDRNARGTLVSRHTCDACGREFTVTPAIDDDMTCGTPPSDLEPGCPDYDERHDVSRTLSAVTLRRVTRGEA